jgi:hypothetical protein
LGGPLRVDHQPQQQLKEKKVAHACFVVVEHKDYASAYRRWREVEGRSGGKEAKAFDDAIR